MNPARLLALALLGVASGLLLIGFWAHKTVTLRVDGEERSLETFAFTVDQLLEIAEVQVGEGDRLWPPRESWLAEGDVVSLERAALVTIQAGGTARTLWSAERIPANVLSEAGIRLYPGDRLVVDGRPVEAGETLPRAAARTLQVRRPVAITLQLGAQVVSFSSSAATLGQALWEAGYALRGGDRLSPSPETPLLGPIEATLIPSREVEIRARGGSLRLRSAASTVGEALLEAGLPLQASDYSLPPAEAPLPANGKIRVVRVEESVVLESEPLPFESQFQSSADLELDARKVIQPGMFGLKTRRVRLRFEDGVEVSRVVEGEYVAQEPRPRVVGYGTRVAIRTMDTPDGPIEYWRAVPMYATSYSPCRIYPDHCDSVTASGATLQKGIAAVTGRWYGYVGGSRIYVPGYGFATIADVGGGIPGRLWIDLGYSDGDYVSWHQVVTVYFLTPVPAEIMWILE